MTLAELAARIGAELRGDGALSVDRVADLGQAGAGAVSFLSNSAYRPMLVGTGASAVIVREADALHAPCATLVMANPYLGYARAAQCLDTTPCPPPGIHPTAVIASEVQLGARVSIGPFVVIESGCVIADDVVLGAQVSIGRNCRIGAGTRLWPRISVYHDVQIGARCIIHSGTTLGSDGFGYAPDGERWEKIPQTGGVRIGDEVEIGANCAIDRGALEPTVIGNGVKLDNFIHIAHNVRIGDHSAMAACTGIAGSTHIGRHVTLSGRVSVTGHLEICDNAHVTACSVVTRSISEPGSWSSGTPLQSNREWRKSAARFAQLDDMARRLRKLEKQLGLSHGTKEDDANN